MLSKLRKKMADIGKQRLIAILVISFLLLASVFVSAHEYYKERQDSRSIVETKEVESNNVKIMATSLWQQGPVTYRHVWPEMRFGWRIVIGTIIGFMGAALGSVGGVGGGGIFVPMLTLIIGFDQKSSAAVSKCMILGGAAATVMYNLRRRHPTLELPIIDYDLALLFQPMLMLGISIGVSFNVLFPDWIITVLLIVFFLATSTKSFLKGIETWKKETKTIKEAARELQLDEARSNSRPIETNNSYLKEAESETEKVSILHNVYWKELSLLVAVWVLVLVLQISKSYTRTCSSLYWILNFLQIPVTVGVTLYEAVSLYLGRRVIASKGNEGTKYRVHKLILYCALGMIAGMVGGLLGLGGGFILGPLFLELGVPPQVSSATATFAMTFSSSMSVIEFYFLKRFPIPYALYLFAVAALAALVGQQWVGKVVNVLGRASLIIFILALIIFLSVILLGGVGIANMVKKIEHKEYMGFDKICS